MHWFIDSKLMHNHLAIIISQPLNTILGTIEDLVPFEGPGGLLFLLAELSLEDDLLVLDLFDLFVPEGDHPFLGFLNKISIGSIDVYILVKSYLSTSPSIL